MKSTLFLLTTLIVTPELVFCIDATLELTNNPELANRVVSFGGKKFLRPEAANFKTRGAECEAPPADNLLHYIPQCTDHFEVPCTHKFLQRYWIPDNPNYSRKGPLVIGLSGEKGGNGSFLSPNFAWTHYVEELDAFHVFLETRYAGESVPYNLPVDHCGDPNPNGQILVSLDENMKRSLCCHTECAKKYHPRCNYMKLENSKNLPEYFRFNTVQQSLEDIASFIPYIQQQYPFLKNRPVVVYGGSYSGTLALRMRTKYPHLVNVAVNSGGPVVAKLNFTEFLEGVSNKVKLVDRSCHAMIGKVMLCIRDVFKKGMCHDSSLSLPDLKKKIKGLNVFFASGRVSDEPEDIPEAGYFNALVGGTFINPMQKQIKALCDMLTVSNTTDLIDRYFESVKAYEEGLAPASAAAVPYPNFNALVPDTLGWVWMKCTELGYFQPADKELFKNLYGLALFVNDCEEYFAPKQFTLKSVAEGVDNHNRFFGGFENLGTCVVHVTGELDAWNAVSVYQCKLPFKNAHVKIQRGEHIGDLSVLGSTLSKEQRSILNYIRHYLWSPQCNNNIQIQPSCPVRTKIQSSNPSSYGSSSVNASNVYEHSDRTSKPVDDIKDDGKWDIIAAKNIFEDHKILRGDIKPNNYWK